jgi:carbamoyl-phosphate synthase large subunit
LTVLQKHDDKPITVLITAAGSELAMSVIKACRLSSLPLRLVACDIVPSALGLYWAERSYLVPAVRQDPEGYLRALLEIVRLEDVKAIIPTSDHELAFLPSYRDAFRQDSGCWIIINPAGEMARFSDKWLAHLWYLEHGLPAPHTALGDDAGEIDRFLSVTSFPIVLKPRQGGGSRSIFLIRNHADLGKYLPVVTAPLLQEYLAPDDEEYTAGTFRTRLGDIHVIVMRRDIKFGMTYRAEVVFENSLEDFCRQVMHRTRLEGINNIQFRRTENGPKILEINPRFSSTAGIRAHFGFNEPEMAIRECVLDQHVSRPEVRKGKVHRYMNEQYLPPDAANPFVDLRR